MSDLDLDPAFDLSPRARLKRFAHRVINTRYLMIALLIHIIALAIFGGKVIFDAIVPKGEFESESEVLVAQPPGPPPPPPSSPPSSEKSVDVKVSAAPVNNTTARIATSKLSADWSVPPPDLAVAVSDHFEFVSDGAAHERVVAGDAKALGNARAFLEGGIQGGSGKRGATGKGRATVAKFTCYVAQYAGGDWDCNFGFIADNRWYSNCIYNLMLQIGRWTQGRVKAELKPEALKLSSREWIDKIKPPFIFMTGHKNFTFTQAEVENLREYLMLGGALWVDNSLPGRRSRFDIALRREMKKVLPDRDFEPINSTHPAFREYFNFAAPPKGMNFYQEPVEVIKVVGGQISVFYTLNAYSDLWETGLTPKDEIDQEIEWSQEKQTQVAKWGPHYNYADQQAYHFFRNVDKKSITEAYQFGINIVIHLLTRFQDQFATLPRNT